MLRTLLPAACVVLFMNRYASALSLPGKKVDKSMYAEPKCPFNFASEKKEINHKPSLPMKLFIKSTHFLERKMLEAGAFESDKKLVRGLTKLLYTIDLIQMKQDPEFHLKRREVFGDNFITFCTLQIGKYDPEFKAKDSIDARLVTYPHAKKLIIGSLPVRPKSSFWYGPPGENGFGWNLTPLFLSDPGSTPNPICEPDGPDHTEMRNFLMDNFVGESHMEAAIARQTDEVGSKLLKEYGENVKGKSKEELEDILLAFMPKFMMYCLFDVDVEKIPIKAIDGLQGGICQQGFFQNQIVGPGKSLDDESDPEMAANTQIFRDFIEKESKVLKNFTPGPKGLGLKELSGAIPAVFVTAAFLGTRDLTNRPMQYAPDGHLESVVDDDEKLKNAILEVARLKTPVPFSGQVVDDEEGLTTQIGKRTFTFKKGTPTSNLFQMANLDEKRFPNPYVFDPENRDFSKLTSFNSVGLSSYETSPKICPGREFAINAAMNINRAKIYAEKA